MVIPETTPEPTMERTQLQKLKNKVSHTLDFLMKIIYNKKKNGKKTGLNKSVPKTTNVSCIILDMSHTKPWMYRFFIWYQRNVPLFKKKGVLCRLFK